MTLAADAGAPQPVVPGVEARAGKFRGPSLIPMLMEIQERHGWLPREELEALARAQKRPLYEIQGLVSFYPHFRTEPPAGVTVRVCRDLTCWLKGADERIGALREQYGDADSGDVEVVEISCPGRCDIAPAATVGERPARVEDVGALVDEPGESGV
ncbi:NAD(P)H-dependent oxidoreductase subunit E, partial [Actinomadura adrarensis]